MEDANLFLTGERPGPDDVMPPELNRFNWNATLWGAFWALTYRLWTWFGVLTAISVVQTVVFIAFNRSQYVRVVPLAVAAYVLGMCMDWGPAIWLGFVANRTLWARGRLSAFRRVTSTDSFLRTQRTWALMGFIWLVFGRVSKLAAINSPHIWSTTAFVVAEVFEVLLIIGLWILTRRLNGATQHAHPADSAPESVDSASEGIAAPRS